MDNYVDNDEKTRKEVRKAKRNIISVFLLMFVICPLVILWILFGNSVSYNIEKYNDIVESVDVLPELDELGNYDDLYFKHFHDRMLFWLSDAYTLKVSYDNQNYNKEKELLSQKFIYQTDTLKYIENEKEPHFQYDGFEFNVLDVNEYDLMYPKKLVFVGFSDKKQEIAYVYYYNFDLDSINTSFGEFLKGECGW